MGQKAKVFFVVVVVFHSLCKIIVAYTTTTKTANSDNGKTHFLNKFNSIAQDSISSPTCFPFRAKVTQTSILLSNYAQENDGM